MNTNRKILTIFFFLFFIFLCLYSFEFEIRTRTNFWIIAVEFLIISFLIILLLYLDLKLSLKVSLILIFILFIIFGLGETNLWKVSLKRYVKSEKNGYLEFADAIDKIKENQLSIINCKENHLNTRPKLEIIQGVENYDSICNYFQKLDCVAVHLAKPKGKYLFVISSFIGNGYGLLYCRQDETFEQIIDERLGGLEITGIVKAEDNWYYVSFT